ncbi:OmpA family protein [Fulvivirgaceae bacterium PWU4]|uniref:OmpA family protein n=1 Tax=Chryseosolibacter histidini TaxID=2782349 RepID=A0AAP2DMK9_9BACT|nr:OmpA family protein [Chryseosolibacter histidini]MBT1697892.1 OmpA family protein [Chryseosolibacter histidini]
MKKLLLGACLVTIFSSCIVTKKKYDDLLAQKVRTEADLADRDAQLQKANTDLQDLDQKLKKLKEDTTNLGIDVRNTSQKLASLEKEHEQLNTYYKNLMTSSGKLNRDIAQQQEQLMAIQQNLENTRKLNDSLSNSLAEREKKVHELEAVLANKDKAVQDLRSKITNALLNFKENDITVKVKNGKVYVSLAEQLLFGSGSVEVDAKGVTALQQLAKAIKDQRDINIMVEGHTDNVPISKKSQYMSDNWDLSVMRATSITRILTKAGVASQQITASGRGEFSPLMANDSPQNKSRNRRTEIIITPDLDELFKILESN